MNGIFREEALEYKKSRWTGKALIISKIPLLFYIVISVFFYFYSIIYVFVPRYY